MVQLIDADIKTREVLAWRGVHVLHYMGSSCSQKLRIFLNLKNIKWESHLVDLFTNENYSEWFLGINPRGLVPVLVHDGTVHIESNDIIAYLEERFREPRLIPADTANEMAALLKHEDDLHLDLRTLSFRFVFAPAGGAWYAGLLQQPQFTKEIEMQPAAKERLDATRRAHADAGKSMEQVAGF
jgi:glutathione S-transferase